MDFKVLPVQTELMTETTVADLGGPVDIRIADFKGFRQLKSNWCWAATSQMLAFAQTGVVLDQAKLAALDFNNPASLNSYDDITAQVNPACANGCDRLGHPLLALGYLGQLLPLHQWPRPPQLSGGSYHGIEGYRTLAESIAAGVPVIFTVASGPSFAHGMVIYGVRYQAPARWLNQSMPVIDLDVYDPLADRYRTYRDVLRKNRFDIGSSGSVGRMTGYAFFGNYREKLRVTPRLCSVLSQEQQARHCRD